MQKGKASKHQERKVIVRQEHLIRCYEIFRQFTQGMTPPPPPLIGHLQGKVDTERMMRLKEEIENREAARRNGGNGEHLRA